MKGKDKCDRFFNQLTPEEQGIVEAIKPTDELTVEVLAEWHDDHLPCVGAKINGVPMGFWWLNMEGAGAFHYADSKAAQKAIHEMIAGYIKFGEDTKDE